MDFRTNNIPMLQAIHHYSKAIFFTNTEGLVLPIWTECYGLDVGLSANFAWPDELGGKLPIFSHPSGVVNTDDIPLEVWQWRTTNLLGGTSDTYPVGEYALQTLRHSLVLSCFWDGGKVKLLATLSLAWGQMFCCLALCWGCTVKSCMLETGRTTILNWGMSDSHLWNNLTTLYAFQAKISPPETVQLLNRKRHYDVWMRRGSIHNITTHLF